jgi:glycosyltransferase involved in cell wall biosynthesis
MITVAICTWNRANLLNQTLSRMSSVHIPNGVIWELLVVNNNSTDHTESVLTSYADKLPLRRVFEATPGLSHARNHAVREAQGDLIIWTDDDVLVGLDWLAAYVDAANLWPKAAFFGGPIEPWFEGEPPRWLEQIYSRIENAFAARNLGQEPRLLAEGKFPFGANMAMRTNVQRRYLFDPRLGLRPESRIVGEESAVFEQMTRDGLEGRWVPGAKVQHFIPKARQTIKYLRSYYRGFGQFSALKVNQEGGGRLFGRPRWVWRKAIEGELLFWLKRYCLQPESWIDNLIQANTCWGILYPPISSRTDSQFKPPHAQHRADE